ncbi:hypothetical protein ACTFIW_010534 [Dictyostelium discoideum]
MKKSLDTSDPNNPDGKLPACKENSCPGIYIIFTSQLVGFSKDSGEAFPFVIDYIGKASNSLYSRFEKHKRKTETFDSSSILCFMKMKKNHLGKNCQAFGVESSLTTKFKTLINNPMEGGYDHHNTELLLGRNVLFRIEKPIKCCIDREYKSYDDLFNDIFFNENPNSIPTPSNTPTQSLQSSHSNLSFYYPSNQEQYFNIQDYLN